MPERRVEGLPRLGRYELLQELEGGGVCAVWLARALEPSAAGDSLVTVLRLHRHVTKKLKDVEVFWRQGRRARAFKHPHAVRVLEMELGDGEVFLVSERHAGTSLARLVEQTGPAGLPPAECVRIGLDILDALQGAHALTPEPLIHGELNPQHVHVGSDGVVRVEGFATTSALGRLGSQGAGSVDRLRYVAPERVKAVAAGLPSSPETVAADIYAVGAILHELLSKSRLYASTMEAAVIQKVLSADAPALSADLPAALRDAVKRALSRDPSSRPADALTFAKELREAGVPPAARGALAARAEAALAGATSAAAASSDESEAPRPAASAKAPPHAAGAARASVPVTPTAGPPAPTLIGVPVAPLAAVGAASGPAVHSDDAKPTRATPAPARGAIAAFSPTRTPSPPEASAVAVSDPGARAPTLSGLSEVVAAAEPPAEDLSPIIAPTPPPSPTVASPRVVIAAGIDATVERAKPAPSALASDTPARGPETTSRPGLSARAAILGGVALGLTLVVGVVVMGSNRTPRAESEAPTASTVVAAATSAPPASTAPVEPAPVEPTPPGAQATEAPTDEAPAPSVLPAPTDAPSASAPTRAPNADVTAPKTRPPQQPWTPAPKSTAKKYNPKGI